MTPRAHLNTTPSETAVENTYRKTMAFTFLGQQSRSTRKREYTRQSIGGIFILEDRTGTLVARMSVTRTEGFQTYWPEIQP